jgi:DNA-binding MarR family transcriptional regulator
VPLENAMATQDPCTELLLNNQLCFALYSTSLLMTKVYKPLLQELGLTYPQYLAMMVLWEGDGITIGDVSNRLLTDPGSVTPLLKRLEAEGLLKRIRSSADERVVELFLTDKGLNLRQQAKNVPSCILTASQRSIAELGALKNELVALRSSLQQAL